MPLDGVSALLASTVDEARRVAGDRDAATRDRVAAASFLADVDGASGPTLAGLLDGRQPPEVQRAAVAGLLRRGDDEAAAALVAAWPTLTPALREPVVDGLLERAPGMRALLAAVGAGRLPTAVLTPARRQVLARATDPSVRATWADARLEAPPTDRAAVVDRYRAALAGAGVADRGRAVFVAQCAACHRLEGVGHEVGPNLAAMAGRGPEAILTNVLDPSREVNPAYVGYVVSTTGGRTVAGTIVAETATSVTLQRAGGGRETVPRAEIEEFARTGRSLMPDGFEQTIDVAAMADLLAYLASVAAGPAPSGGSR